MKMNVNSLMQLDEYPVVTKSYDHEFLKSNSVTYFSQNNAVENYRKYQKKQGSTIIMAWSLIKPISPNFDHSNRFLTHYIPQNFAFAYAYVATLGA